MQSPSSPLATTGPRAKEDAGVSSNVPNGTSLPDGVKNHDPSTHEGPRRDSGTVEDCSLNAIVAAAEFIEKNSADDSGQRSSSSRNGTALKRKLSSYEPEDLQEQSSDQILTKEVLGPWLTNLIQSARELTNRPHGSTLTMSPSLDKTKQTTRKRFPDHGMREILPGLVLGDMPASICPEMLREYHINSIVSLCHEQRGWRSAMIRAEKPPDRNIFIQCQNSLTLDLLVYMSDICDFIDQMAPPALQLSPCPFFSALPPSHSILVHCEAGRSRSPCIILAYLMRKYSMSYKDAVGFTEIKQKVEPENPNLARQLQIWEEVGYNVWEDEKRTIPKAPYQEYLDDRARLLNGEPDLDAVRNALNARHSPYPIGPKFEPPYCCKMDYDCSCKKLRRRLMVGRT
ncbi:phosphatases II [Aaosphaeria arxii CBS 175.79]|uniref:protein-tyrosine-phosphatase n=1 Tax=Aaosphaeria arxii CBS 175.79 TaxID=1450172 RepID=A0A6A5Y9R1_9PLEO|nr:phosphatases II [Aaosphaeria arxii CBS 175.79]KAF2021996.1 phosphatases II [Aaosphaeria arxii CBS 175.79]